MVSKGGKYKGITVYINGIYNKHAHDKKLQPLIKAELSVMTAKANKKPTAKLLGKAEALANKLSGRENKIALTSIKQVQELNMALCLKFLCFSLVFIRLSKSKYNFA